MNDKLSAHLLAHELLIVHLLMTTSYKTSDPAGFLKNLQNALINGLPQLVSVNEREPAFASMVAERITALTTSAVASMPQRD